MKYTTEQLEAIAAKLREMPPVEKKKQEHSKQEAVRILSKEIASLQKRGYTLDQISETLRGEGLSIATPTLKSYLQRAKPAKKAPAQAPGDTPPPRPAPPTRSLRIHPRRHSPRNLTATTFKELAAWQRAFT